MEKWTQTDTKGACLDEFILVQEMYLRNKHTYFRQNKLNVSNETWNKWFLPRIPTSFALFDVIKQILDIWGENVDWEWNDFWWGFWVKNKYACVIMQLCVFIKLFRRYIFENIWHTIMIKKFKISPQNSQDASPKYFLVFIEDDTHLGRHNIDAWCIPRCISKIKEMF